MPLATLSDYVGCAILWALPFIHTLKTCFILKKVVQTPSGRSLDLGENRDKRLEEKAHKEHQLFHELIGVSGLQVIEVWNTSYATLSGENLFKKHAVLLVIPGLDLVDSEAFRWVYKREFYYMVNHVLVKIQMIKALCMTIAAIIFSLMLELSFIPCIIGVILTGLIIESLCRHIVENRADSFALEHASLEEIQGGYRFLTAAYRESKNEPLNQRWLKHLMHPSYWFRMGRLNQTLARAGALQVVNEDKVNSLKALFAKNNQEEQLFIEARKQQVLRWIDADED
jgi:hypothetical protein